jgi:LysM repeat protein
MRGVAQLSRLLGIMGWLGMAWLMGCARLEPGLELDMANAPTMAPYRTAIRNEQRATADLRVELSDRRKDLAEANVARAQLQGMLHETEHRLAEARRVIELQREELAVARVDRERMEQSGHQLHSRLKKLEKLLAMARRPEDAPGDVVPSGYAPRPAPSPLMSSVGMMAAGQDGMVTEKSRKDPPAMMDTAPGAADAPSVIVVRKGETLWRLARRHHVDLNELRHVNGLIDNRIAAGMTLRMPIAGHIAGMQVSSLSGIER